MPKCELHKEDNSGHANVGRDLNKTQRIVGNRGRLSMGEGAFLREEHTNQLTGAERSALKIYIQVIVY